MGLEEPSKKLKGKSKKLGGAERKIVDLFCVGLLFCVCCSLLICP